jgi:hypothetical protein
MAKSRTGGAPASVDLFRVSEGACTGGANYVFCPRYGANGGAGQNTVWWR